MRNIAAELYGGSQYDCIWYLTNCGFALRLHGKVIFIDPVLALSNPHYEENRRRFADGVDLPPELRPYAGDDVYTQENEIPLAAGDVEQVDLVLLSHSDSDHLDAESLRTLAPLKPTVLAPGYCHDALQRAGLAIESIRDAKFGADFHFDQLEVKVTYAKHHTEGDCGYLLETGLGNIYYPGDTKFDHPHKEEMCALDVDYLLLPINDTNMGVGFAAQLTQILQPRVVIPCHFGFFWPPIRSQGGHPAEFLTAIAARGYRLPDTDIAVLRPGGKVVLC